VELPPDIGGNRRYGTGGIDQKEFACLAKRKPATGLFASSVLEPVWRRITTYPVLLAGPLEGKQIHVGRVALHECLRRGHLMPTPAGQAKVDRNVAMGIRLFLGQLL
jgi:hypothetical protein